MYKYQENKRYFALIAGGMEDIGANEFEELGAKNVSPAYRGLYFNADKEVLYNLNYQSRITTRILAPLITFPCHDTKYLYKLAKQVKWQDFFNVDQTFAIFASVSHSSIKHSKYAALCLKDAIVDQYNEKFQKRPNIDTRNPDVWLNLHIQNNDATISLDTSGGSLHRRGYRKDGGIAPMQETVAATIVRLSQWNGTTPLFDPMCGSGTILTEALMHYCKIPPAYFRENFGFMHLPDYDAKVWQSVKSNADSQIRQLAEGLINGSDVSRGIIKSARINCNNLPDGDKISLKVAKFESLKGIENSTIISNPPYGIRLKSKARLGNLYKELGNFLKQRCAGSTAYLYCGERELIKSVELRTSWKKALKNGALDGRLVKYEIY